MSTNFIIGIAVGWVSYNVLNILKNRNIKQAEFGG